MIRITDHMQLFELYKQGLCYEGAENVDITWNIAGKDYTFTYDQACCVFATVEDWFVDLKDSTSSRAAS